MVPHHSSFARMLCLLSYASTIASRFARSNTESFYNWVRYSIWGSLCYYYVSFLLSLVWFSHIFLSSHSESLLCHIIVFYHFAYLSSSHFICVPFSIIDWCFTTLLKVFFIFAWFWLCCRCRSVWCHFSCLCSYSTSSWSQDCRNCACRSCFRRPFYQIVGGTTWLLILCLFPS